MAKNPKLGRTAEVEGYCRMRQGQHVVFYEVDAESNVLVVRVLHRRMLPALHLI